MVFLIHDEINMFEQMKAKRIPNKQTLWSNCRVLVEHVCVFLPFLLTIHFILMGFEYVAKATKYNYPLGLVIYDMFMVLVGLQGFRRQTKQTNIFVWTIHMFLSVASVPLLADLWILFSMWIVVGASILE